jgi:uncharacterized protein YkwD
MVIDEIGPENRVSYRARWLKGGRRSAWSRAVSARPGSSSRTQTPAGCGGCPENFVVQTIDATNALRAQNGLRALTPDAALGCAAQQHARAMIARGAIFHDGWWDEIVASGYKGIAAGQNVARAQGDGYVVVGLWANSPLHRDNLLNSQWQDIGIGCVVGSNGDIWWAQNFGAK